MLSSLSSFPIKDNNDDKGDNDDNDKDDTYVMGRGRVCGTRQLN